MVGKFVREMGIRDQAVIATKFTFGAAEGDPNAGGNGRKNMLRALEGSLRRLDTEYIDLYRVHAWDTVTPAEEVMHGLNALVESGKVRHVGLSDCPARYVARAQTLAEWRGWERLAGLQIEYNLTERSIEHEYVPLAQELGMGICVWSPLASGLLSGKHSKESLSEGRLKAIQGSDNPVFERIAANPRNWDIVAALQEVAQAVGRPPAEVSLSWITRRPGVSATILGATKLDQLKSNLAALDFTLPPELAAKLGQASKPETTTPYMFFGETMLAWQTNGTKVAREPEWFR